MNIQIEQFKELTSDLSADQIFDLMYRASLILSEAEEQKIPSGSMRESFTNLATLNQFLNLIYLKNADSAQLGTFLLELDCDVNIFHDPIKAIMITASSGKHGDQSELVDFLLCLQDCISEMMRNFPEFPDAHLN
jgi:hypothetical protein